MYCKNCGFELKEDTCFCSNCGHLVNNDETVKNVSCEDIKIKDDTENISFLSKIKKIVINHKLVVIIVVIALLGGGTYTYISNNVDYSNKIIGCWGPDVSPLTPSQYLVFKKDKTYRSYIISCSIDTYETTLHVEGRGKYSVKGKNIRLIVSTGAVENYSFSIKDDTLQITRNGQTLELKKIDEKLLDSYLKSTN